MKSFNGKVAAITGAASGIGRSLAVALANQRCDLALSDVNEAGLKETAKLVSGKGIKTTISVVNVAKQEEVHQWADEVIRDHGKVNMIFNNAGVALGGTVEHTDYKDYEWMLNINLWGVIYGTKAFLPLLKESGEEGQVINISSIFGLFSQPTQSAYNAAKFAVRGFSESLRQELDLEGGKVSATCVHPGGIKTNIAKNARMNKSIASLGKPGSNAESMRTQFESLFITTPDRAAEVILNGVKGNKRRVLIGPDARVLDVFQRLLPAVYQTVVTTSFKWAHR